MGENADQRVMAVATRKVDICNERARLIDAKFLGKLSATGSARLSEIEAELERRDAPRVAEARARSKAKFAAIDEEIAALKARVNMKGNAPSRSQAKTAKI